MKVALSARLPVRMRQSKASKMAESLRRLVNIGSFSILQEKLEKWLEDYHVSMQLLNVYAYTNCHRNRAACSIQKTRLNVGAAVAIDSH